MTEGEHVCHLREYNSSIMTWIKFCCLYAHVQCISELFSKFEIPTSNTLGGLRRHKQYHSMLWWKYVCHSGGPGSKFCFPHAHVQCMSELCSKFQIPATNTVGADAETRTRLQCDMVQNLCHLRGQNSEIMTLITILFPLCTCPIHVWTVLQVANPCKKYCGRQEQC